MRSTYPKRTGSALVVLSAMILVSLAIASYAINVEYMEFVRTEMQISTDMSVRAACRALVDSGNSSNAILAAQRLANENRVAGQTLVYTPQDISLSTATRYSVDETYEYKNSRANPNTVSLATNFFKRSTAGVGMIFPTFGVPVAFRPVKSATAVQSDIDIVFVLDCSGSMVSSELESSPDESLINLTELASLPLNARWYFAESGVIEVLDQMALTPAEEHVGLCTFGTAAATSAPLTYDYDNLKTNLAACEFPYVGGLSNVADGLAEAGSALSDRRFARPWACRFVLLISDGKLTTGGDPVAEASRLAEQYIKVFTISIADEADQTLMQQIAEAGQGEHLHASDVSQFGALFSDLSRRIPILITK